MNSFHCVFTILFLFLIKWLEEEDVFYDVVSSKDVVPPEGVDILDVISGTKCRVSYKGQYYKAEVLQHGTF